MYTNYFFSCNLCIGDQPLFLMCSDVYIASVYRSTVRVRAVYDNLIFTIGLYTQTVIHMSDWFNFTFYASKTVRHMFILVARRQTDPDIRKQQPCLVICVVLPTALILFDTMDTLTVSSKSAHGPVTVSSRSTHGQAR